MSARDLFAGLVVRLVGFSDEQKATYTQSIKEGGGNTAMGYTVPATHLVASSFTTCYDDPYCLRARRDAPGCVVVNEYWLDDAIDHEKLPDPQKVTFKLPRRIEGISSSRSVRICCAGYNDTDRKDIKRMVDLMGATFYGKFKKDAVTHLICTSPKRTEYADAKVAGIPVVTKSWIEDCLAKWTIVSVELHSIVSCSPEQAEIKKQRPADHITASEYLSAINLTVEVNVPQYRSKRMGSPELKYALLGSLGFILDEHLEEHSLGGLFSFKDITISRRSKAMRLRTLPRFPYTLVARAADRERFVTMCTDLFDGDVPADVLGWLDSIKNGTDGFVLRKHINMMHPSETFAAFIMLYDAFMDLSSHEQRAIRRMMEMKDYENWSGCYFRWNLLQDSLDNKDAWAKEKEEARRMTKPAGDKETEKPAYRPDVRGLIPFLRDTFVHPAAAYKFYMLAILLLEGYENLLKDLQEELYRRGKLPNLKY